MFADFQKYHIKEPCLLLSNFVGGGAFGDIYQGTALPHRGASVSVNFDPCLLPRLVLASSPDPSSPRSLTRALEGSGNETRLVYVLLCV